uniref:Uncharacterized protein n=1 Tax=Lactuca sativa TaxID=4236 RepID=A0A9R1UZ66_LACSA|nr:hypothetical protein LSAT_V11C700354430 [Lactuca sativa]
MCRCSKKLSREAVDIAPKTFHNGKCNGRRTVLMKLLKIRTLLGLALSGQIQMLEARRSLRGYVFMRKFICELEDNSSTFNDGSAKGGDLVKGGNNSGAQGSGLSRAVKRVPQLEKLHLTLIATDAEDIERIGRNCAQLRSFQTCQLTGMTCDDRAIAIANNMPELRHLKILNW